MSEITENTATYPRFIAHRGGGTHAPENTMAAFDMALKNNYQMFECDVKLSADGVPYLLHDSTLDRTTSASPTTCGLFSVDEDLGGIPCGDQTWDTLSQLDAGSWWGDDENKYEGEKIPTLEEVASWCIENDVDINLEIKPVPGTERETGKVVAQYVESLWEHSERKPLLTSFSLDAIEEVKREAPSIPKGVLFEEFPDNWYEKTLALECDVIVCKHHLWTEETIRAPLADGITCLAYTVNDRETMTRLLDLGCEGVITDMVKEWDPELEM